jgi:hypothetical protein
MANGSNVSKGAKITGWVLTGLIALVFIGGGIFGFTQGDKPNEQLEKFGWTPQHMQKLAIVEIVCGIIYLIPQTAGLGAILLTGYLGGAVATHVRVNDPGWFIAVIVGIIVWLGLFLRDSRLRQLVPLRT